MNRNATNQQIHDLLEQGLSNNRISHELRCCKTRVANLRRIYQVPAVQAQPLTLNEKWQANTREVDGGHLHWDGPRQSTSGTPVMTYRGKAHTAAAIAFRIRTSREPEGYAYAECGYHQCVAPAHVNDTAARMQVREALRHLTGRPERPEACLHGHDQAEHGRLETDGRAYCEACKRHNRAKSRAAAHV
ncbi:hypothetical protein [Streptomyces sp. NPDC050738]|uniref:hypothetical protein n=1 Tax=Streptomyces sp. NPDC050738 TaxID=3154744 RepID=UPI0034285F9A